MPNVEFEVPVINKNINLNPNWISGFITGEGSFTYFTRSRVNKDKNIIKDYTLAMEVSQDSKDWFILNSIKNYFNVGAVYNETRGISKFRLTQRNEIINILIPFFKENPLFGRKSLQFNIWIKIVNILVLEKRTSERDIIISNLIKELSSL